MAGPTWRYVTDGGMETDLIHHHGADLPEFAAYPLLRTAEGRTLLRSYYEGYAAIAARAGAGLRLESPTWRASADWGRLLGDDAAALDAVNRQSVDFLRALAAGWSDRIDDIRVVGTIGPRAEGVTTGPDDAADYHAAQVASFAAAGADEVAVLTLTDPAEALGVARAAAAAGITVVVSFTVETEGRLADGTSLGEAVTWVDADTPPAYYMVNCAHPRHVSTAVAGGGAWLGRVRGLRANASTLSHAELDEAEGLDEGDLDLLVSSHRLLEERLPALEVVGGCCGTDARHVAALWGVPVG